LNYSISTETSAFFKNERKEARNVIFSKFEILKETNNNTFHSFGIGYGKYFSIKENDFSPIIPFEYSYGIILNNHFFEIGGGFSMSYANYLSLKLGYRILLNKYFLLRVAYTPKYFLTYYYDEYENKYRSKFHDLGFGIEFRFPNHIGNTGKKIFHRFQSVELLVNPYSLDINNRVRNYETIEFSFLFYKKEPHVFSTNIGIGNIMGGIILPISINYLYGHRKSFFEANLYFHNFGGGYAPYGKATLKALQPQLGYRYNFNKPFFVRVAYAPYFRMVDWKFRDGMEQSMVFGFGYRFQK
jgi:hypothetical protein